MDGQPTGSADRFNRMKPWDVGHAEGKSVDIPPGACVVEHTIFCGKDHGLTVWIGPADAPRYLTGPALELSENEALVLYATGAYKASYAGKDRYQMALADAQGAAGVYSGCPDGFPTRAEWDATKLELISKGLLNKAGALTNAGRNARSR